MVDETYDATITDRIAWVSQQNEVKDEADLMISNRTTAADSLESRRENQNSDQNLITQ